MLRIRIGSLLGKGKIIFMKYKLADICKKITSGGTPKSNNPNYYGGNIPWLRTQEVNFTDIEQTEINITEEGLNNSSAKWIPAYTIIIAMYGATAGKSAITNIPLTTNQACCNLIIDNAKADYRYIYYKLKLDYEILAGLANGGAQQNLNAQIIANYEIDIPELSIQQSIALILSSFDRKIVMNAKINHHLEQVAQAIFKSWFVDFKPFLDKEFIESEVWSIPKGWKIIKFSSFLTSRTEKSNDSSIPMFSVTDNGIFLRSEKFNINLSSIHTKNKIIKKTDIVFGMSREVLNWGIMRSEIGGVSSAYNVFSVDNSINTKYFESFIKTHPIYFKDLIRPASREGQSVDKGALMEKSIYLPPLSVLEDFYAIEDSLTECIKANVDENRRLATLRDTLLPRLMSGELRVSDIEPSK